MATRLRIRSVGDEGIVVVGQSAAGQPHSVERRQETVIAEVYRRAMLEACQDFVAATRPYYRLVDEAFWTARPSLFGTRDFDSHQVKHCASGHSALRLPFVEDWHTDQRQQG